MIILTLLRKFLYYDKETKNEKQKKQNLRKFSSYLREWALPKMKIVNQKPEFIDLILQLGQTYDICAESHFITLNSCLFKIWIMTAHNYWKQILIYIFTRCWFFFFFFFTADGFCITCFSSKGAGKQ